MSGSTVSSVFLSLNASCYARYKILCVRADHSLLFQYFMCFIILYYLLSFSIPAKVSNLPVKEKGDDCGEITTNSMDLDNSPSKAKTNGSEIEKEDRPQTETSSKPKKSFTNFDKILAEAKYVISRSVEKLQSADLSVEERQEVTEKIRKSLVKAMDDIRLSKHNEGHYEQVLSAAVELNIPKLVSSEILKYKVSALVEEDVKFLIDCFWILTKISSGEIEKTKAVITAGAVQFALETVQHCIFIKLVTQCVMLLGNVLVDDETILSDVLQGGILDKLFSMFYSVDKNCQSQIIHLYFSITKTKQFCLPMDTLKKMLHQASGLLKCRHPASVLIPVMNLINEATNDPPRTSSLIDFFTEFGYIPQLASCMSHKDATVRTQCLMSVGNLLLGSDKQTWAVLNSGMLSHLVGLLYYEDVDTAKHTLWILSNVAAGEERMMDVFLDFQYLPTILYYLTCQEPKLVIEALYTLTNLLRGCSRKMRVGHLVQNKELVQGLLTLLKCDQKQIEPNPTPTFHCYQLIVDCFEQLLRCLQNDCGEQQSSVKETYSELGVVEALKKMVGKALDSDGSLTARFQAVVDAMNEI